MSMLDQVNEHGEFLVHDKPRTPQEAIEESGLFGLDTGQDSYTQQSFIEECDINNIVRKYMDVGAQRDLREPIYGDFSEVPDYQEAFEIVQRAADSFAGLSSDVRTRFANDPGNMIAFLADEKNLEESYTLGLRARPVKGDADRIIDALDGLKPAPSAPADNGK